MFAQFGNKKDDSNKPGAPLTGLFGNNLTANSNIFGN